MPIRCRTSWLIALMLGTISAVAKAQQRLDPAALPGRARVSSRSPVAAGASSTASPATGPVKGTSKSVPAKAGVIVQTASGSVARAQPRDTSVVQSHLASDLEGHDDEVEQEVAEADAEDGIPVGSENAIEDPDLAVDPLEDLRQVAATPIDLLTALRLAGEQSPLILLGQQQVVEAVALRQLAAAQFLPTINVGSSVDSHWGVLQQSNGNILSVRRESVFVGAGANAIAAGTVNIPGVLWTLNASDAVFNYLVSRQEVERREFASQATTQDALLRVALAYNELVRSETAYTISMKAQQDAWELRRKMRAHLLEPVAAGRNERGELQDRAGNPADFHRSRTERNRRAARRPRASGENLVASAALCRTLHLDPSIRLVAAETQVIPRSIVPDAIPLPELLAIALLQRPELNERRVAAAQSLLALRATKMLPFSPTVFLGFSAGGFGGGSDIVAQPAGSRPFAGGNPRFSTLDDRRDLDAMAFWTLQNLGVGNKAQIDAARSRLSSTDFELLITLDRVRSEVAAAHAKTHARFARIRSGELAIQASELALAEDMTRIDGGEGLPLEAIDSLRLLEKSRLDYLQAIIDYNTAQFELYVALGKPPASLLVRPAEQDALQDPPDVLNQR
jgi:outer membrane protein TolC